MNIKNRKSNDIYKVVEIQKPSKYLKLHSKLKMKKKKNKEKGNVYENKYLTLLLQHRTIGIDESDSNLP